MNQPLNTLLADAVTPGRDLLPVGEGLGTVLGRTVACEERFLTPAGGGVFEKGRVLLLEADPCFREAIEDCLFENGYEVVAVENSQEGLRRVMDGDFSLVLYDLKMPGLAPEMFFQSVRRVDPDLCERFVFMSADSNDEDTQLFIRSIGGSVLQKPFDAKNLLGSIAVMELRGTVHSVLDGTPTEPIPSRIYRSSGTGPAGGSKGPEDPALAEKVAQILARAQNADSGDALPDAIFVGEPRVRAGGVFRAYMLAGIALLLLLAAGLGNEFLNARARLNEVSVNRVALQGELAAVSPQLQKALAVRAQNALERNQLALISAERAKPHWAPMLRCIVPPGDARIDILGVDARAGTADPDACEIRVRGAAGGAVPRQMADRFRQSVEEGMKKVVNGRTVSTRFERLEDSGGARPDEKRAGFVMIATIGSPEPPVASSGGGH